MRLARGPVWRWCGRWWGVLVVALAAAVVTAYPTYSNWPPIRSDGAGYHLWTYALLKGDLTFAWFEGEPSDYALHQPDPGARRFTCKYPPGVALLRLPVMACLVDPARSGPPFSPAEHWAVLALGAVALVAAVALGADACLRAGASPRWANLSVLMLAFGTGLFSYGTYDAGFSHVYTAALAAGLVWAAVRAVDRGRPFPVLGAAAVVALLLLVRTTNIVLVGAFGLGCMAWAGANARSAGFRARAGGAVVLGVLGGLAATLAVNRATFGRFTLYTYPGEEFNWADPHLLDVLGGEGHGLFRYYPALAVALAAPAFARGVRWWGLLALGVVAAYVVLYGHWWSWHLGAGFGHRGFVDAVPLVLPVCAVALTRMRPWLAWTLVAAGGAATVYTVVRLCMYWGMRADRVGVI